MPKPIPPKAKPRAAAATGLFLARNGGIVSARSKTFFQTLDGRFVVLIFLLCFCCLFAVFEGKHGVLTAGCCWHFMELFFIFLMLTFPAMSGPSPAGMPC